MNKQGIRNICTNSLTTSITHINNVLINTNENIQLAPIIHLLFIIAEHLNRDLCLMYSMCRIYPNIIP